MLATMLASQALANNVASIFYNVQFACMLHKKLIIKFRVLSRDLGLGAGGKLIHLFPHGTKMCVVRQPPPLYLAYDNCFANP